MSVDRSGEQEPRFAAFVGIDFGRSEACVDARSVMHAAGNLQSNLHFYYKNRLSVDILRMSYR